MTKEEQEQRFRTFVQGDILTQRLQNIHNGYPVIVRAPENEPWQLTSDQLEAISVNTIPTYQPQQAVLLALFSMKRTVKPTHRQIKFAHSKNF